MFSKALNLFLLLVVCFQLAKCSIKESEAKYEKQGGRFEVMFKTLTSYMNRKLIKTPAHTTTNNTNGNVRVLRISHDELKFVKTFFENMLHVKESEENVYWKLRSG
jgi:hypothetical protein